MTTVLLVLVCLLATAAFVQFAALIEMFNQLQQVRRHLEMFDMANPIDLGAAQGLRPSAIGLPAHAGRRRPRGGAVPVQQVPDLLHPRARCWPVGRCRRPCGSSWCRSPEATRGFVEEYQLFGERILVDEQELIVIRLGMDITPAAVIVRTGQVDTAHTVPTARQLFAALEPVSENAVVLNERK